MKRLIISMVFLFIPSYIMLLLFSTRRGTFEFLFPALYILSFLGVVAFFIFRPCNFWFMFAGFFISPFYLFLYDTWHYNPASYFTSVMMTVVYVIPFLGISLGIALIIMIIKKIIKKVRQRRTKLV